MDLHAWAEYLLRFAHLVAGIAWIGTSLYFIWLDSSFEPLETPSKNVDGELFMVHGGFYYRVEKRKLAPGELPKTLHWFKWEATLTWLTGFTLLIVVYWLRGASLLIDPSVRLLTQAQAIGLSLGAIVGTWLIYDTVWHPERGLPKKLAGGVTLAFFTALVYGLTRVFSGRGAFIMTGAIFGSLMLLNVWVRILPGQTRMFKAAQAGQVPDYTASTKSKTRSVHNTYFTFPVLLIMLSNHYPGLYQHSFNWALLLVLMASGALLRHAMVRADGRWAAVPAALGVGVLVYAAAPHPLSAAAGPVTFAELKPVIERRCLSCHAAHPTDDVFKTPPNGFIFETEEQLKAHAAHVKLHVVTARSMPLGNKTGMTEDERALFGRWLDGQPPGHAH